MSTPFSAQNTKSSPAGAGGGKYKEFDEENTDPTGATRPTADKKDLEATADPKPVE